MHFRLFSLIPPSVLSFLLAWYLIPFAKADYWAVNSPTTGVEWVNGQTNLLSWTKGLLDGIDEFDVEMQRLSVAGLTYIAHNVPASMSSLNVYLQDVPAADDYYVMFVNSTHGILYASSPSFAIANTSNGSTTTPASGVPTVTISGAPNPTDLFATTFAGSSSGGTGWRAVQDSSLQIMAVLSAMAMCILGGVLTVL
ncbi:hypothetical protein IEO21_03457 [Rhodonia placenta]|uniref:Uncharacterized protein n=1 Tax=Rhodonia placenta TaxID=104341 RepID=A0A8H7U459_9APHY|nr:hypothetical protein IEO21_03457 [Postia placenta]